MNKSLKLFLSIIFLYFILQFILCNDLIEGNENQETTVSPTVNPTVSPTVVDNNARLDLISKLTTENKEKITYELFMEIIVNSALLGILDTHYRYFDFRDVSDATLEDNKKIKDLHISTISKLIHKCPTSTTLISADKCFKNF